MLRKLQVSVQDEEGHSQFEIVPVCPQPSAVDLFSQRVADTNLKRSL